MSEIMYDNYTEYMLKYYRTIWIQRKIVTVKKPVIEPSRFTIK